MRGIKITEYNVRVNGIDKFGSILLEDSLRSIENVEILYPIKKVLEFKAIFTDFIINIGFGVASGLIATAIYNFLKNAKSRTNKPITISINKIEIVQGDKIEVIEDKINQIINSNDEVLNMEQRADKGTEGWSEEQERLKKEVEKANKKEKEKD